MEMSELCFILWSTLSNGNVIIIAKLPHSHITSIDSPLGSYANHIDEWISHNSLVVSPNQIWMRLRSSKSWTSLSASPSTCLSLFMSVRLSVCPALCLRLLMPEHKSPKMYDDAGLERRWAAPNARWRCAGVLRRGAPNAVDCPTANCNCTTQIYPAINCGRWRIEFTQSSCGRKNAYKPLSSPSSGSLRPPGHLRMIYRSMLDSTLVNYTFFVNFVKGIIRFTAFCRVIWIMIYRLWHCLFFCNPWNEMILWSSGFLCGFFLSTFYAKWSKLILVLLNKYGNHKQSHSKEYEIFVDLGNKLLGFFGLLLGLRN